MKAPKRKSPQIPLVQALAWIVASSLLISGTAHLGMKHYFAKRLWSSPDAQSAIQTLIQTGPQKEALKTEYLAELLNISADFPPIASRFDLKKAAERLRSCPLIAEAQVKLIKPSTLYVDYTIRQPVAWLMDYDNTVIDRAGYPFPFRPFFSPKNLPEIYIGLAPFGSSAEDREKPVAQWNHSLQGKHVDLALNLLSLLSDPKIQDLFTVKRIDVSNAYAESYGTREIVVIAEDSILLTHEGQEVQYLFPKILRLSTKNYALELGNFLKLREQLLEKERGSIKLLPSQNGIVRAKETIIDFRIPNLAFIDDQKAGG